MNYRHAFHAGGFADVHKHAVLALLLKHLRKKETPFAVLDSHAGAGLYDLTGAEAQRTGEAQEGVFRLLGAEGGVDGLAAAMPEIAPYLDALRAANPAWPAIRAYPGSPMIARAALRPQDRLVVVELHPEEARALRQRFAGDRQVSVHEADAYTALKAHLPPKERRGLVLIDPPFEQPDEFRRLIKALPEALKRFATGVFALWYPIKDPMAVERFKAELAQLGRPVLIAELFLHPPEDASRLNGSGMAIVNPPWQLDAALERLLPVLAGRLGAAGGMRLLELGRAEAI